MIWTDFSCLLKNVTETGESIFVCCAVPYTLLVNSKDINHLYGDNACVILALRLST